MKFFIFIFFLIGQLIGFRNFDNKSFTFISSLKSIQEPTFGNYKDISKNEIKYTISLDSFEKDGFVKKAQLLSTYSIFVHCITENNINNYNYYVMKYSVKQKLKTGVIKNFVVGGPLITNELRQSFKILTNGDSIIIFNVFADGPNGVKKINGKLIFTIKEI